MKFFLINLVIIFITSVLVWLPLALYFGVSQNLSRVMFVVLHYIV